MFLTRGILVQEGAEWRPAVAWLRGQYQGHRVDPRCGHMVQILLSRVMLLPPGRCDGTIPASGRPIGWVPTREELQLLDIEVKYGSQIFFATSANIFCQDCEDIHELLSTPSSFWREEVEEMRAYFSQQVTGLILMRLSYLMSCVM